VVIADALDRQLRSARVPIEFGGSLLRVLGEVHEHRAGTSGLGDDEASRSVRAISSALETTTLYLVIGMVMPVMSTS